MRDNPVHHYLANTLLKTAKQADAGDLLVGLLLLRKQLEGQNLAYYAGKWRVGVGRLYTNSQRARGAIYPVAAGAPRPTEFLQESGAMLPVATIKADYRKYAKLLDDLERDLVLELDDARCEALIYGMFKDTCNAVFLRRNSKRAPRAKAKRPPGRPPGSKNKPKQDAPGAEGWLMPDGSRVQL